MLPSQSALFCSVCKLGGFRSGFPAPSRVCVHLNLCFCRLCCRAAQPGSTPGSSVGVSGGAPGTGNGALPPATGWGLPQLVCLGPLHHTPAAHASCWDAGNEPLASLSRALLASEDSGMPGHPALSLSWTREQGAESQEVAQMEAMWPGWVCRLAVPCPAESDRLRARECLGVCMPCQV